MLFLCSSLVRVQHDFDFSDIDYISYYISFVKALSLKLNNDTVQFFFNFQKQRFVLYTGENSSPSTTGLGSPAYCRARIHSNFRSRGHQTFQALREHGADCGTDITSCITSQLSS